MGKKGNGGGTQIVGDPKSATHVAGAELLSDDDTAELPVLDPETFADADAASSPAEGANDESSERAEKWVRHVEGEVERLRKLWESLDKELTAANEQSAELHEKLEQRDATIAELHGELASAHKEIDGLAATVVERDDTIKSLGMTSTERVEELTAVSRSLDKANARVELLEDRLLTTQQRADELHTSIQDEKSRTAGLGAEKEAALASNANLRSRLQDLETYIDGRRDKWSEQKAALKSLEDKVASLEKELAGGERSLAERDSNIESLELRIRELEREAGEIEGRHKEREAAHQEARALLQERIAEVERLKAKLEQRAAGADSAIEEASSHREELEALRASLTEKDEAIHRLETGLGKLEAVRDHIKEQQEADQKTISALRNEIAQLESHSNTLTEALDDARTKVDSLSDELDETTQAESALRNDYEEQERRIAVLEAALNARAEIIASFDANAKRLNELGRNLNALGDMSLDDEQVPIVTEDPQNPEMLDAEALLELYDIDEHAETAFDVSDHDLQHVNDADDERALAQLSSGGDAGQALRCAMIELGSKTGDRPVHVISAPITTIGRSKSSDIRISDIVISRTHARLLVDTDSVVIEDASSKNGLAVNAEIVHRAVLKHGDVVSLGNGHAYRYVELKAPPQTH